MRFLTHLFILVCIVIGLLSVFYFLVAAGAFGKLPSRKELKEISTEEATLVFSSDNVIIGKYFAKNRTNVEWKDIPLHLRNALIATEDRRFFSHRGIDLISYARVFVKNIILGDKSAGGGSTLTQQITKNLFGRGDYGALTIPVNKLKEIIIASRLERIYNKEELLLLYLNSVPFGEDVYGVESASRRYFSKPARNLKIEEAAVLVGMLKANTYYNPITNPENSLARRNMVLTLMENEKYIPGTKADSLKKLPLKINYEKALESPAGYFVHQVKRKAVSIIDSINRKKGTDYILEKDGLKIYTTLDMKVQAIATEAVSGK